MLHPLSRSPSASTRLYSIHEGFVFATDVGALETFARVAVTESTFVVGAGLEQVDSDVTVEGSYEPEVFAAALPSRGAGSGTSHERERPM